jgi:DnaK suppressor protein
VRSGPLRAIAYLGDVMAERTKEQDRAAVAATDETTGEATGMTGSATVSPTDKPTRGKSGGGRSAAKREAAGRSGAAKSRGGRATTAKGDRSAAETERIRAALAARLEELRQEYQLHMAEITELQRDRFNDSAGDDQADTGNKTFEREQEISLAQSILERTTQVERALERLEEGNYGWCERCGNQIPVERLAAFPSATLCVSCKQLEERR